MFVLFYNKLIYFREDAAALPVENSLWIFSCNNEITKWKKYPSFEAVVEKVATLCQHDTQCVNPKKIGTH